MIEQNGCGGNTIEQAWKKNPCSAGRRKNIEQLKFMQLSSPSIILVLPLCFVPKASLDEPVQKTLMNVKKTLATPDERKHQTNERKCAQAEWFTSADELKVSTLMFLCLVQNFKFPLTSVFKMWRGKKPHLG